MAFETDKTMTEAESNAARIAIVLAVLVPSAIYFFFQM
jgi:hypothetical protein